MYIIDDKFPMLARERLESMGVKLIMVDPVCTHDCIDCDGTSTLRNDISHCTRCAIHCLLTAFGLSYRMELDGHLSARSATNFMEMNSR